MRRRLAISGVGAAALYAALMLAWPLVARPYAGVFAFLCQFLFSRFGFGGLADVGVVAGARGPELELRIRHARATGSASLNIGLHDQAYMATALVVALVVATPVAWRRRLSALPVAAAMVYAFLLLGVWTTLIDALARWPGNPMGLRGTGHAALRYLYLYTAEVPMMAILVPVLAWITATFRRGDWALLVHRAAPTTRPPAQAGGVPDPNARPAGATTLPSPWAKKP